MKRSHENMYNRLNNENSGDKNSADASTRESNNFSSAPISGSCYGSTSVQDTSVLCSLLWTGLLRHGFPRYVLCANFTRMSERGHSGHGQPDCSGRWGHRADQCHWRSMSKRPRAPVWRRRIQLGPKSAGILAGVLLLRVHSHPGIHITNISESVSQFFQTLFCQKCSHIFTLRALRS